MDGDRRSFSFLFVVSRCLFCPLRIVLDDALCHKADAPGEHLNGFDVRNSH